MIFIITRFIQSFVLIITFVLLIDVFTFENTRFLQMAKTNIERAKKLKVYLYLRYRLKRQFMQTILTHILSIIPSKKHPHSIWVKPRSQSFWYETMTNHWDEERWIKNMRISDDAIHSDYTF